MRASRAVILLAVLALVVVSGVAAAPGIVAAVEHPRSVMGSGATAAQAGGVELRATLGQPFVGVNAADGVTLGHGYWHGADVAYQVYLPLVLRSY
jgi:hypothetical protein